MLVDELRSAINGVDHAPTELVLTRQCADVSKLMYTCASMGTSWTMTCSPRSMGNFGQIIHGGRPPQVSRLGAWGCAPP